MSALKHGISVRTPGVRCLTAMKAVRNMQYGRLRTLPKMKLDRNFVRLQTIQSARWNPFHNSCTIRQFEKHAEQGLDSLSLSPLSSFYKHIGLRMKAGAPDLYYLFTFKSVQNFSPNISKILEGYLLTYISRPLQLKQVGERLYLELIASSWRPLVEGAESERKHWFFERPHCCWHGRALR